THWLAQHELEDLYDIYDEMLLLPLMDVSLQVPLPRLSSPAIERLRVVFADDDPDPDEAGAALEAALPLVDTPECRAALARDVIRLTGAGRIDQDVAAAALIQLAEPNSGFLKSSLGESASVAAGSVRTPSGLLVAAG